MSAQAYQKALQGQVWWVLHVECGRCACLHVGTIWCSGVSASVRRRCIAWHLLCLLACSRACSMLCQKPWYLLRGTVQAKVSLTRYPLEGPDPLAQIQSGLLQARALYYSMVKSRVTYFNCGFQPICILYGEHRHILALCPRRQSLCNSYMVMGKAGLEQLHRRSPAQLLPAHPP